MSSQIATDKWKGYRPIAKSYNITQVESDKGTQLRDSSYHDPPDKVLDMYHLFMGKRLEIGQIFQ